MKLALIWAMSENRVIGAEGRLPWRLPDEMRAFRRITSGNPIIVGRRTYESFGGPLPERTNIVVTRQTGYRAPGAVVAKSLDAALDVAAESTPETCFVIGGSELYAAALPRADRLYMTVVHADLDGDTRFPEFDEAAFTVVSECHHERDDRHAHAFTMRVLERRA